MGVFGDSYLGQEYAVTPWEVKGKVDYLRLAKEFGVQLLTEDDLNLLKDLTSGDVHYLIRRGFFYAHRGFREILNRAKLGESWALYNGRGPSGDLHVGHLVPWILTKWFVDKFNVQYFFELTDDEKFLVREGYTLEETNRLAYDNALSLIALGFTPDKLHIIVDSDDIKYLYKIAVKVAKKLTLSTVKNTFGFTDSNNIGAAFFPAIEIAVAFLPTELFGKETPVLIPTAIDQDPYFRLARDVAESLNYPKPATLYSKFLPGLTGEDKMSASNPDSALYVNDDEREVRRKIMNAFTGGQPTVELQRRLGGNPDSCPVYKYHMLIDENDEAVKKIYDDCRGGRLLCGECKLMLYDKVKSFLSRHRELRERARDKVNDYRVSVKFK
ncbi:tryptophan--tRNA ligase [Caldivirga maquilingensis]|uniref:Tryptophan--tRNA ligase n=1 Tax=Caldivirga maquilingensis (strain ATCC 700844 / DSM 13496 / JCM 10307 / IC-167) TaxID=397948 RepID=A8MBM6_CALMQ|nr:tryptophanyl-tRNA synthetase [Caldivirga maquilingensis IC-167]